MHVVMKNGSLGSHSSSLGSSGEKLILLTYRVRTCTSWFARVRSRFQHDLLIMNNLSCFRCVSGVIASFTKEVIDLHLMVDVLHVTTSYGSMLSCCVDVVCVVTIVGTCCCLSGCDALGARPGGNYYDMSLT